MLSTQFQPCDARRAFPCFDEPAIKASFKLSIEIPDDQVALSNMPVKSMSGSTRHSSSQAWQWKVVHFEKSPAMSTYLYTWAVGDFGYIAAETARMYNGKPLPVRVYTTKGLEEQGRLALEYAWRVIDLLSEVNQFFSDLRKLTLILYEVFQIVPPPHLIVCASTIPDALFRIIHLPRWTCCVFMTLWVCSLSPWEQPTARRLAD
jgi:aminopeptidase N